jgi:hypothetical protein|tara:strand:- start:208 stop:690 length:483 start_codon:yes stop_codon:yes gene_type:complete
MKLLFENWREYIDEVERHPDIATTQDEIQKSLDYFYQEHAPSKGKRREMGDWKGHKMVAFDLPKGTILFFAVDEQDRAKAYVGVDRFRDSYSVGNVRKTKGGGFYTTDLYKWLADQFGTLYSDVKQTTAGESIWRRLQQDPEVNVEEPSEETGGRWRLSK